MIKFDIMRKTLIALFILFSVTNAFSQTRYDTCHLLNRFEGEWRYTSGGDTVRIYLKVGRVLIEEINSINDVLVGWHEYKQGSTVIESNYQNRFTPILFLDTITNSASIGLGMNHSNCTTSNLTVMGSIRDYLQANEGHSVTAILNSAGTTLTWKQRHSAGFGVFTGATGMTLPKEFQLVKQ